MLYVQHECKFYNLTQLPPFTWLNILCNINYVTCCGIVQYLSQVIITGLILHPQNKQSNYYVMRLLWLLQDVPLGTSYVLLLQLLATAFYVYLLIAHIVCYYTRSCLLWKGACTFLNNTFYEMKMRPTIQIDMHLVYILV